MRFGYSRLFKGFFLLFLLCVNFQNLQAQIIVSGKTTEPKRPPTAKSNESTKEQLKDAQNEGDAVDKCTDWVLSQTLGASGQMPAGEYKITYAITAPEGWYEYANNSVNWREPANATAHLWIFVQDGADKRIVPPLDINARIVGAGNALVENKKIPFAWIPLVNGYGDNLNLPANGNYHVIVDIAPPEYRRHDPYNGDRFTKPTHAEFPAVNINLNSLKTLSDQMEARQDLSKAAGDAYGETLQTMYKQANDGKDTTTGDYTVAYAIEYAEAYWFYDDGNFRYKQEVEQSADKNAHFEALARDRKTGRFLPNLNVTVNVSKGEKQIGEFMLMFMWHPWLYHYGENWRVPRSDDNYRLHIHMDAPAYKRYGKTEGKQFTAPVDVDFSNVKVLTGEK